MKILISAAEASSDAHGAQLLRALKAQAARTGVSIDAFGIGGPKLQAEGLRALIDTRSLLVMGFHEILSRLPRIFRALRTLSKEAERERPDVAVVLDYPDFHFRLARRLKRIGIPVVYYIPPKVWAWRKGRLKLLKQSFVKVLSILPFEVDFYRAEGVPVTYVGNPLLDALPWRLTKAEARQKLGVPAERRVLVLMPGSRPSELKMHAPLFLESALRAVRTLRERGFPEEKFALLMPLPVTARPEPIRESAEGWLRESGAAEFFDLRVSQGDSAECLVAADAGIIKSGTSTLEAGLLGCPHVVVYRPSRLAAWIFQKLIRYRGPVGLVNLVADGMGEKSQYLMTELLCQNATVPAIGTELACLLSDSGKDARIREGMERLKKSVFDLPAGDSPSARAAAEVFRAARGGSRA